VARSRAKFRSLFTSLVSDRIATGRNAMFGHVARRISMTRASGRVTSSRAFSPPTNRSDLEVPTRPPPSYQVDTPYSSGVTTIYQVAILRKQATGRGRSRTTLVQSMQADDVAKPRYKYNIIIRVNNVIYVVHERRIQDFRRGFVSGRK